MGSSHYQTGLIFLNGMHIQINWCITGETLYPAWNKAKCQVGMAYFNTCAKSTHVHWARKFQRNVRRCLHGMDQSWELLVVVKMPIEPLLAASLGGVARLDPSPPTGQAKYKGRISISEGWLSLPVLGAVTSRTSPCSICLVSISAIRSDCHGRCVGTGTLQWDRSIKYVARPPGRGPNLSSSVTNLNYKTVYVGSFLFGVMLVDEI